MTHLPHTPAVLHPEKIHPSLWRGSQLAPAFRKTISTGYPNLDDRLPGHGWPTGALIEILSSQPGSGEMQLLKPALRALDDDRNIILLNPPYMPSSLCLQQWLPATRHIFWIRPDSTSNTLWAAEKILQHNTSAALLCWFDHAPTALVHRLHLAVRQSSTLFFSFRPRSQAAQSSVAPLRLNLELTSWGLNIRLLKHPGSLSKNDIPLELYPCRTGKYLHRQLRHDALDQHTSAPTLQHPEHAKSHGDRPAAIHS